MALLTAGMTFARQGDVRAAEAGALCYLVADAIESESSSEDGISTLTSDGTVFDPDSESAIFGIELAGGVPTTDIEASAFDPFTQTLYAINAQPGAGTGAQFGSIDPATGAFTPIGSGLGATANQPTPISLADVDGLTVSPIDGTVWAVVRRADTSGAPLEDALIRIDPTTGTFIAGAFSGADYVLLTGSGSTTSAGLMDVDDIAVSPITGVLYGVANDEGTTTANSSLVIIDPATGVMSIAQNLGDEDVEGLSFYNDGTLWATIGRRSTTPIGISEFLQIDLLNGAVPTTVGPIGVGNTNVPLSLSTDVESLACLTGAPNVITGTLFVDPNGSGGIFDPADGDTASALGLTVNLYRDLNGDGVLDANDIIIATTTTDANGDYSFTVAASGAFLVELAGTAPGTTTTPTFYAVDFGDQVGQTDADNDFGYNTGEYDLALVIAPALGQATTVAPGATIAYGVTVTNQGDIEASAFDVTVTYPGSGWTLSAASVAAGWIDNGDGTATLSAAPGTPLQTGDTWAETIELVAPATLTDGTYTVTAEISDDDGNADGDDDVDSLADSDPANDGTVTDDEINGANGDEDDHDIADITIENPVGTNDQIDLSLSKDLAAGQSATIAPGDSVTYTLTVTNDGAVAAASFEITDTFPTGWTLAAGNTGWTDNGTSATFTANPSPALAGAGGTWSVDITLVAGQTTGSFNNTAEITADDGDDVDSTPGNNNPAEDDQDVAGVTVEQTIVPTYDLALTTTLAAGQSSSVNPGDTVTFQVNVTNQGDEAATTFTITNELPDGFTLTQNAIDAGWVDNNDGTVSFTATPATPLASGDVWTQDLELTASTTPGTYTNTAEISTDDGDDADSTPDDDLGNDGTITNDEINGANGDEDDHDIEQIVVLDPTTDVYDLALTTTLAAGQATTVNPGDTVTFKVNVTNQGTAAASSFTIQDELPDGFTLTAAAIADGWVDNNDGTATRTVTLVTPLAPGDTWMGDLALMVPADATPGTFTNTAEISSDDGDDADSTPDDNLGNDGTITNDEINGANGDEDDHDIEEIVVEAAGTFSLGNRVFEDTNGNGVRDAGEPSISGVTVELWQDTDGDGVVDSRLDTTTTDNDGGYTFSGLAEGEYVVVIPAAMFIAGAPLANFTSSNGVGDLDVNDDDDGIDPITAGGLIRTGLITVDANTGDRTEVDFGFVPGDVGGNNNAVQSIGDIVFNDANDNGVRDAGEAGIAGVLVQLFEDTTGDGIGDTLVETTTTDANGAYSFDLLPNGSYVVVISSSQFTAGGALEGFASSNGVGDLAVNDDDDGIDPAQAGGDVLTGVIVLSDTTNGALGIDFGFVAGDGGGLGPDVDLEISKTLLGVMKTNSTVMWSIVVTNNGPDDETTAITMTDVLPFGLTAITAAGNGWACDITGASTTVSCNRTDGLTSGSSLPAIVIETSVDAAVGTEIYNQARVDSETVETIINNNRAQDGGVVETGGHIAFTGAYSSTMAIFALSMISMGLAWSMMRRREDLEIRIAAI